LIFRLLECGDLSPLSLRGGLTPRFLKKERCDRSQLKTKAVTGHRTPKSGIQKQNHPGLRRHWVIEASYGLGA
jgi:hypothetical protein